MVSRASARRNQASSPPKESTQSPVRRRMRTRSASVEPVIASVAKRRNVATRQASVENTDSDTSSRLSDRDGRRRKANRGATQYPELSQVEEEIEVEGSEDEVEQGEPVEGLGLQRSPGGLSQISGTTAITSTSGQNSHGTLEVAGLDATKILIVLPDLWDSSLKVLALLPTVVTVDSVEALVQALKVPGSVQAKRLMHREQKFKVDREAFGNDTYIRPSFILQKLLGSQELEHGMSRPDTILQAANIATFVKELLVKPKEGQDTYEFISELDTWFPELFVSQSQDNVLPGNSNLFEESFQLALEIRTQLAITMLLYYSGEEVEWDPKQVLAELFFDPLEEEFEELSFLDDALENGNFKKLMRAGPDITDDQEALIKQRVLAIFSTFRQDEDAANAGDLINLDQVDQDFPWTGFQATAINWAKSRIDEIMESVRLQGGAAAIVESLVEAANNNSQAEVEFVPEPATIVPSLLPSPEIVPATSGHNLMSENSVRRLENMKQRNLQPASAQLDRVASSSKAPVSSSMYSGLSQSRPGLSRSHTVAESEPEEGIYAPASDDADPVMSQAQVASQMSTLRVWEFDEGDNNKENIGKGKNAHRTDRHHGGQKTPRGVEDVRNTGGSMAGSSKRPRSMVEDANSDDEISQDEGFQTDHRVPDPSRRTKSTVPAKRVRIENYEDEEAARTRRERDEDQLQASARRGASEDVDHPEPQPRVRRQVQDDGFDFENWENDPVPTANEVMSLAKQKSAIQRQRSVQTQSRTPWSLHDTELLIDSIGKIGCSWAMIAKSAEFEDERRKEDQVGLKDKARNLKVSFLKAGTELPRNFEKIALGKKLIQQVRNALPNYNGDP